MRRGLVFFAWSCEIGLAFEGQATSGLLTNKVAVCFYSKQVAESALKQVAVFFHSTSAILGLCLKPPSQAEGQAAELSLEPSPWES